MTPTIFILISALIIILVSVYGFRSKYPYEAKKNLLTKAEFEFYKILKDSISPSMMIAPKVRLADIVTCSDSDWSRGYGTKISSKHIDFVLYDTVTANILLAIELDDASHAKPDRKRRDQFVNELLSVTKVPFLRVPTALQYNINEIRNMISESINNA
jgi:hypothetical protein